MEQAYREETQAIEDHIEEKLETYSPLQPGNSKLGIREGIYHTGHLPIVGCCGSTATCREVCYAVSFIQAYKQSQSWYGLSQWLLDNDRDRYFTLIMNQLSRARAIEIVRWHVSGDFIDADHAQRWGEVVDEFPDLRFFSYTRSWRGGKDVLEALEDLRARPNVQLLASIDEDIRDEAAELVPHWRWADIVPPDTPAGWIDDGDRSGLLCPNQVGKEKLGPTHPKKSDAVTCADCRFCIDDREGDLMLRIH